MTRFLIYVLLKVKVSQIKNCQIDKYALVTALVRVLTVKVSFY